MIGGDRGGGAVRAREGWRGPQRGVRPLYRLRDEQGASRERKVQRWAKWHGPLREDLGGDREGRQGRMGHREKAAQWLTAPASEEYNTSTICETSSGATVTPSPA